MTVPCCGKPVTVLRSLIQYMTERMESKDRWVGALQQSEVARILINGPADPISGAHAAEGYASLCCAAGLPHQRACRAGTLPTGSIQRAQSAQ